MTSESLVDRIDALLPQTQCTKCGYAGCRPYAEALAHGEAPINRCPPGGEAGMNKLAQLLGREPMELDRSCGTVPEHLHIAFVDEAHCIGCTLCIQACPVDAIIGANKLMHTVVPELCTGCELCVAPCPVDCIDMVSAHRDWTESDAQAARMRHRERAERLARLHDESTGPAARTLVNKAPVSRSASDEPEKKKLIADVLAKARARRHTS